MSRWRGVRLGKIHHGITGQQVGSAPKTNQLESRERTGQKMLEQGLRKGEGKGRRVQEKQGGGNLESGLGRNQEG